MRYSTVPIKHSRYCTWKLAKPESEATGIPLLPFGSRDPKHFPWNNGHHLASETSVHPSLSPIRPLIPSCLGMVRSRSLWRQLLFGGWFNWNSCRNQSLLGTERDQKALLASNVSTRWRCVLFFNWKHPGSGGCEGERLTCRKHVFLVVPMNASTDSYSDSYPLLHTESCSIGMEANVAVADWTKTCPVDHDLT